MSCSFKAGMMTEMANDVVGIHRKSRGVAASPGRNDRRYDLTICGGRRLRLSDSGPADYNRSVRRARRCLRVGLRGGRAIPIFATSCRRLAGGESEIRP